MGGRMASILLAEENIKRVEGLVFYGFPLHAVGRPSVNRADHLKLIKQPMLFLSGTRDIMGDVKLMKKVCKKLGSKAKLVHLKGADHSFKVLKSGPISYEEVISEVGMKTVNFIKH